MKNLELQAKARILIPGGGGLLSKRAERFAPGYWPDYFSRAKGAEIWDLENVKYLDMSIGGIGANVLGYADDDVNEAVIDCVIKGNSSSLNPPEEVELAERLLETHPWADMVRYARTGGESMAIAVRIVRALTGKDIIVFCGYHGWHDWYLAANLQGTDALNSHHLTGLVPAGVPMGLKGTAIPFHYNRIDELERIIERHKNEIAAIVMEPMRDNEPQDGFLHKVRELANQNSFPLVFDEITAAFRINMGGIHLKLDVEPDIAVFGKAISNGYPMGAIIGRSDVMKAAESTFISSTYWTEKIGPVAALATMNKFREQEVWKHLVHIGKIVQEGWKICAKKHGLEIDVAGIPPLSHFSFKHKAAQVLSTIFVQMMLDHAILASDRFYAMFSHTESHCNQYLEAVDKIFSAISLAVDKSTIEKLLKGSVAQQGFQRLT